MTRIVLTLIALHLAAGFEIKANASYPEGVFGRISKVVFEPNEEKAERVQVWGTFCFAMGVSGSGSLYTPVQEGYLYYTARGQTNLASARAEWKDLQSVAGTDQWVAFGSRYGENPFEAVRQNGILREKNWKVDGPDGYPLHIGVTRVKAHRCSE